MTSKEVLQLFVGSWDSETTTIPDGDPTKVETSKMIRNRKWSPEETFIVEQSVPDDAIWVLTYDLNKKNYRSVYIAPAFSTNIYGNWDEAKQVMTRHGKEDTGSILKGQHRVIDKDHHEWEVEIMRGDQLLVKIQGKLTRRPNLKKPSDDTSGKEKKK